MNIEKLFSGTEDELRAEVGEAIILDNKHQVGRAVLEHFFASVVSGMLIGGKDSILSPDADILVGEVGGRINGKVVFVYSRDSSPGLGAFLNAVDEGGYTAIAVRFSESHRDFYAAMTKKGQKVGDWLPLKELLEREGLKATTLRGSSRVAKRREEFESSKELIWKCYSVGDLRKFALSRELHSMRLRPFCAALRFVGRPVIVNGKPWILQLLSKYPLGNSIFGLPEDEDGLKCYEQFSLSGIRYMQVIFVSPYWQPMLGLSYLTSANVKHEYIAVLGTEIDASKVKSLMAQPIVYREHKGKPERMKYKILPLEDLCALGVLKDGGPTLGEKLAILLRSGTKDPVSADWLKSLRVSETQCVTQENETLEKLKGVNNLSDSPGQQPINSKESFVVI